jgi:hypothetical protein
MAVLRAANDIKPTNRTVFIAELGLDGRLRPVRGILPAVMAAVQAGYPDVVVAHANLAEASLVPGANVRGYRTLARLALDFGADPQELALDFEPEDETGYVDSSPGLQAVPDMADVSGQGDARRALEVAAAGAHHLLLTGPPGAGKSQIARAIAYRLWTGRGREVADRHGAPFYGFVELQPGPSSDEFFFRYDYVPVAGSGGQVALVDSAFVQAMREGWVVMIDEVNTARDVALLSINATLDGRLSLYLAATGETVVAQPGFAVPRHT